MTIPRINAAVVMALVACLAGPSEAQAPPLLHPTRDVVVGYRVDGQAASLVPGGIPGPVRLSWDAASQRLRAEADGRSQVALLDLRRHAGQAIDTALHVALPLPLRAGDLQLLSLDGVRLLRGGQETVAGLVCTAYRFESAQGPGSVCLTVDGVPLRGQGTIRGRPGAFTAQSVRYGALPPALFEVPPGYLSLTTPGAAQDGPQGGALAGALGALLGRRAP